MVEASEARRLSTSTAGVIASDTESSPEQVAIEFGISGSAADPAEVGYAL